MKVQSLCLAVVASAILFVAGCGMKVPAKLEVRDVTSGRTYTTYQPWGEVEKGVGYAFTDIESGRKITLTTYEIRTLEGEKTVPPDSAEGKGFVAAKEHAGMK